MQPGPYGPFAYVPIINRPMLTWPGGARIALWVVINVEFFPLDEVLPGSSNERVARNSAHVPNVRNWSQRDYGNRVGIWRLMEVLSRHGIRATVALNSLVCDHHPRIVEAGVELGWEFMGHGKTNVTRMDELPPETEREVIYDVLARIEKATGRKPAGWLGPGLAETWDTLDYLAEAGCLYVCDWVNDDQPYRMDLDGRTLVAIPYTLEINDVPLFFINKVSNEEYERRICAQFDVLYREGAQSGRVMAIALHPFVTGVPHRIDALDRALAYISSHESVWKATGEEIVRHFLSVDGGEPAAALRTA